MNIQQCVLNPQATITHHGNQFKAESCQLVLAFAERTTFEEQPSYSTLKTLYPNAQIVLCSTSGQIAQTILVNKSVVATAFQFENTPIRAVSVSITDGEQSFTCGRNLFQALQADDLAGVLVLSEGSFVNGTELLEGIQSISHDKVTIFGGLAGDEMLFQKTLVGLNEEAHEGCIVGIGFYGKHIQIGHGFFGGWDDFGPERLVTRSEKNVLFEIDHKPALEIYKEYLGKYAAQLPSAALHFPLSMRVAEGTESVVRTILNIHPENSSMTFAGNIPEGAMVRLMKSNPDRLIDAAYKASKDALSDSTEKPNFALLISCVGRRIVLEGRTDEELEGAREVFGEDTVLAGFYSYGEISPTMGKMNCNLHNQTMTIATLSER